MNTASTGKAGSNTIHNRDGTAIYYNVIRPADTNTAYMLVLLHGLGGSSAAWNTERALLQKQGYATCAIDLRGHGFSGRPKDAKNYSIDKFVSDVHAVMQHENITRCTLVGHCFGGMIAIAYTAAHPTHVRELILIDTSYKPTQLTDPYVDNAFFTRIITILANHASSKHPHRHLNFTKFIGSGDFDPRRIYGDITHTSLRTYLLSSSAMLQFDATDLLAKITIPTLVITGKHDHVFPPPVAHRLKSKIRKASLHSIARGNHITVINNPQEVTNAMHTFLQKNK